MDRPRVVSVRGAVGKYASRMWRGHVTGTAACRLGRAREEAGAGEGARAPEIIWGLCGGRAADAEEVASAGLVMEGT